MCLLVRTDLLARQPGREQGRAGARYGTMRPRNGVFLAVFGPCHCPEIRSMGGAAGGVWCSLAGWVMPWKVRSSVPVPRGRGIVGKGWRLRRTKKKKIKRKSKLCLHAHAHTASSGLVWGEKWAHPACTLHCLHLPQSISRSLQLCPPRRSLPAISPNSKIRKPPGGSCLLVPAL